MAIRCVNLDQVTCDDCGKTILLGMWQDAAKLGWAAPIDGAFQRCPNCTEKYKAKIFREARLTEVAAQCPLANSTTDGTDGD